MSMERFSKGKYLKDIDTKLLRSEIFYIARKRNGFASQFEIELRRILVIHRESADLLEFFDGEIPNVIVVLVVIFF